MLSAEKLAVFGLILFALCVTYGFYYRDERGPDKTDQLAPFKREEIRRVFCSLNFNGV